MEKRTLAMTAVCALALAGCEGAGTAMQTKTGQGALVGGLLGAGTGAIIGEQSGKAGAGTAIGAGLGALSGAMVGQALDQQDKKIQQQQYPPASSSTPAPAASGQKFCPVGGETYPDNVKYCPNHGVELRYKE